MEEAYRARIQILENNLKSIKTQALSTLESVDNGEVTYQELILIKLKLKEGSDRYSHSINHYLEKSTSPSCNLITTCTENQLEVDDVMAKVEAILQVHANNKPVISVPTQHTSKLPTLQPPRFSGDILTFHQFWDKFEATIDRRNLEDVDKLSYLMASLEGKALEVVDGLGVTNHNYKIAVEALKHQFGNKDVLIDAHYEALKHLPTAQGPDNCRRTLNTIEHHLRVLQTLGENIEGNHLRTTITSKFPDQVLYELNLAISPEQNTVPVIRSTLDKIIKALERTQPSIMVHDSETPEATSSTQALLHREARTRTSFKNKFMSGGHDSRYVPAETPNSRKRKPEFENTFNSNTKKPKVNCIFCENSHYSSECLKFKTISERKEKLGYRCYKCFRTGHQVKDCRNKKKCYHCKEEHHQALCPKKTPDGNSERQQQQ